MSETRSKRKVEFIESYWTGGELGSDYQWNDNHGELVRCKDCKHRYNGCCYNKETERINFTIPVDDDWFCADGEKDGSQIKRPQKTFWDSLSEADLMEPMHHFEE